AAAGPPGRRPAPHLPHHVPDPARPAAAPSPHPSPHDGPGQHAAHHAVHPPPSAPSWQSTPSYSSDPASQPMMRMCSLVEKIANYINNHILSQKGKQETVH
ncbi:Protein of unknown function, partial [Gryllus bimaculatus]